MNVKDVYKWSGYLSIAIGTIGTLCIYGKMIFYAVVLSVFGFIFAGINIFLNQRHYFEQEKYPKGYVGMFLSSLPVVFVLMMIFLFRK